MKYIGKPVEVEAYRIARVGEPLGVDLTVGAFHLGKANERKLLLDNGEIVTAAAGMLARMTPAPGDYWVIQADGYAYLNPKDVFERKYALAGNPE